tara:strand:+ start:639 stop:1373 length:735 start_codon:yes stop_codon:yes gene_type:complete
MSDIVTYNQQQLPVRDVAEIFAASGMFPDARSAAEVATKLIVGRSLGMSDYDSMAGFHIIKGKVNLSANSMAAAIKNSGRYNYKITTHTNTECVIEFYELFNDKWELTGESVFSVEDAKRAGLGGDNWRKYPKAMLFARAISAGYKMHCPGALGMAPVYVEQHGETEIPQDASKEVEVIEELPNVCEDNHDKLKQWCADYEARTGKNVSGGMCDHFGVENIDEMTDEQVDEAIDIMIQTGRNSK